MSIKARMKGLNNDFNLRIQLAHPDAECECAHLSSDLLGTKTIACPSPASYLIWFLERGGQPVYYLCGRHMAHFFEEPKEIAGSAYALLAVHSCSPPKEERLYKFDHHVSPGTCSRVGCCHMELFHTFDDNQQRSPLCLMHAYAGVIGYLSEGHFQDECDKLELNSSHVKRQAEEWYNLMRGPQVAPYAPPKPFPSRHYAQRQEGAVGASAAVLQIHQEMLFHSPQYAELTKLGQQALRGIPHDMDRVRELQVFCREKGLIK